MEESTLREEVQDDLELLAKKLVEAYKQNLREKGKSTGTLYNSAKSELSIDGEKYSIQLKLADYWNYVENGRRAGKFPPINEIKNWIRVKGILPRAENGRLPTENQLAFLISRKIARTGIPATNALSEAVTEVNLEDKAKEIFLISFDKQINNIFNEFKSDK